MPLAALFSNAHPAVLCPVILCPPPSCMLVALAERTCTFNDSRAERFHEQISLSLSDERDSTP